MFNWQFENFIYAPAGDNPLKRSHAQLPTPWQVNDDVFRFYYSSRDDTGQSRPFFLDYSMSKQQVLNVSEKPALELGESGCFDDCGIMPSSIVQVAGKLYFYYIGWNQRKNISYQLAIGLAISDDGGKTFKKYAAGPVLDRNIHDPMFCAAPCVHFTGDEFTMWYISCTGWPNVNGRPEPVYLVKRATSPDGISWQTSPDVCIPYKYIGEAIGRPWVVQAGDEYNMWYSSRGSLDYRQNSGQHYCIGYASSPDGLVWTREDEHFSLTRSNQAWDSNMQEYSALFEYKDNLYMVYNGNTFGKAGFGLAKLLKTDKV
jgi:hypothetical protein